MAEIQSEPKRGRSSYEIELTAIEQISRLGTGIVSFKISSRGGQKENELAILPIVVDAGPGGLDGMAARACEKMGDALNKMLGIVDGLRDHYSKTK
jgi:hypothetical protein